MALDNILRLMESRAEQWMSVNQAREIIGTPKIGKNSTHKIDFYPRQISYNHKEITEIELISENGGLITEPDTSTRKDYRLRVESKSRGFG